MIVFLFSYFLSTSCICFLLFTFSDATSHLMPLRGILFCGCRFFSYAWLPCVLPLRATSCPFGTFASAAVAAYPHIEARICEQAPIRASIWGCVARSFAKIKYVYRYSVHVSSASNGTRTHDPRITNALLYHLSHRSTFINGIYSTPF